jgi:hypothetical protein
LDRFLYKVSAPRDDWTFHPRPFWRTEDWSSSDHEPRDGYIEDHVLYAAGFDEINIHLLPDVWRLRVWLDDVERATRLEDLGYSWPTGSKAVIFALASDRESIESFSPTIFTFEREGFERAPTDEFVSWEPRTAISAETVAFADVRRRWQFALVYVTDADALRHELESARIDHQIQT